MASDLAREALDKAIKRLDHYGAPDDTSAVYVSLRHGPFYELIAGEVALTLGDLRAFSTHTAAGAGPVGEAVRRVSVSPNGVAFGDYWVSHEKLTGIPAAILNQTQTVEAKAYMEWLNAPDARPVEEPGEVEWMTREREAGR